MWYQFLLENIHFAINVFAALVMFATGWLYFDAWLGRKNIREGLKVAGFLLLSCSFLVRGVTIDSVILKSSLLPAGALFTTLAVTRISGYILIILGLLIDPLQSHPDHKEKKGLMLSLPPINLFTIFHSIPALYPVLGSLVAFLYLHRSTIGLESHLKTVALSFFILSLTELLSLASLFQDTSNVDLYKIIAPFGPVWIVEHSILVLAITILGYWVWSYLLKRFQSQLFMILTASILVIFLLTTISFTGLLLKNLQDEAFKRLQTDVKVLNYAIDSKKAGLLADAQALAQDPQVIDHVEKTNRVSLGEIAQTILLSKKMSLLIVVNDNGQVLARGEDRERVGDSISDDPLIKRSLLGESPSSIVTKEGVLAPEVSIRAATPIKSGEEIIGAVMVGSIVDNAFVDGVNKATGLQSSIYGMNILSATTLVAPDGKSRWIGIKEESKKIKEQVLSKGESFAGEVKLLNVPYFAAYLPLKDVDEIPVGMLFVGEQQLSVLQAAGRSIELTFLMAALLIVLSIIPAFLIARYLVYQIR